jgi:signal transduction histidine kinase
LKKPNINSAPCRARWPNTEERQRIMRELHDGVGSHLVGLLNLAHSKQLDPQTMEEAVREALDEMRMAVDSMQASDINLPTAVANLRYRLQPRFDIAGIRTLWQIPEESAMPAMATADVFQWQRILLEAFTNVLKHSRAGHVVVVIAAQHEDERSGIVVEIRDDGVGLDGAANHGQGLRNMHHRAQAIGAQLSIETNPPHGVAVRLSWFGSRPTNSHPDPASHP